MQFLLALGVLALSYLIGAIPFGLIIVRLKTGQDVRKVESGRTGGTNVMRAAGFWAGFATAILDILKGTVTVYLAAWLAPGSPWLAVLAPTASVIGHNYSVFLAERTEQGRIRLRGGAGGATTVGGAMGLWLPSLLVVIPIGVFILYFVGYASLATISVAVTSVVLFSVLAWLYGTPWQYAIYGILTGLILAYALRPNIRRLLNGTERVVGYRARGKKKDQQSPSKSDSAHSSS